MSTLTASVLAAVRGRKKGSRLESEPEENLDEEVVETGAEDDEEQPAAESEEEDTSAENDERPEDAEDEEKQPQASTARVRRAEQGRIRSILTHPKADANPGLAAELAFGERFYSAKEAGALLEHSSAGTGSLAGRMKGRSPKIGSGSAAGAGNERQALVAGVQEVIQSMHGRKPKNV
ncbi:hypothetical protein [Nitratireductor pacificus]|uniref:Uncharacterized protein n=1 Tax=Nitratireductor pacificus pht-3B TaxID=391937 RepID=K2M4R1_9HYPH|nr:hypothetical protein [Nitratireductor pacificus]EKF17071.1 hypothetical protein NA2_19913 [Nitratireductor pacificus pht-3B]